MVMEMKHIDYHYKQSTLTPQNEREYQTFGILNKYGYNFGNEDKRNVNEDIFFKHKMIVNKDFINSKR